MNFPFRDSVVIKKLLAVGLFITAAFAQAEKIELQDGRVIELNLDGTWSFVSTDRLLGTSDGRQVRLRQDGTWAYTGEMVSATAKSTAEVPRASLGDLLVTLDELAIETARSSVHKSSRKKTQTVFQISVVNRGASNAVFAPDEIGVAVEDSDGREYPVVRIEPETLELEPGQQAVVEVRADGSPHWFTTRSMKLQLGEVALKGLMAEAKRAELKTP